MNKKYEIDDSTYDTVFQTQNGSAMILRVHMPVGNPAPVPKMTLVGVQATHPWIDDKMRITGYQYINSQYHWSTSGIKLGQAVDGVIKYFQLNPPNIVQITDPGLQRIQESIQSRNASAASFSSTSTTATNLPLPYNQALKLDGNSSASAYNDIVSSFIYSNKYIHLFPNNIFTAFVTTIHLIEFHPACLCIVLSHVSQFHQYRRPSLA